MYFGIVYIDSYTHISRSLAAVNRSLLINFEQVGKFIWERWDGGGQVMSHCHGLLCAKVVCKSDSTPETTIPDIGTGPHVERL